MLASVTEYPVPGIGKSSGDPGQIVVGPDGNLWFTDASNPQIDEVTTSGKVTVYPYTSLSSANGITNGPDGALWFTDQSTNKIGRITTSGAFSERRSLLRKCGLVARGAGGQRRQK